MARNLRWLTCELRGTRLRVPPRGTSDPKNKTAPWGPLVPKGPSGSHAMIPTTNMAAPSGSVFVESYSINM